jgi:hypothetical protein
VWQSKEKILLLIGNILGREVKTVVWNPPDLSLCVQYTLITSQLMVCAVLLVHKLQMQSHYMYISPLFEELLFYCY